MKRWKKIAIGILLALLVLIAGLAVWQKDNLKAVYMFLTSDSENISQNLEDKRQEQQETLEKDYNITIQAPTTDQSNALLDGNLTPEEVKQALGLTQELEKEPEQEAAVTKPSAGTDGPETAVTPEAPIQNEQPKESELPDQSEQPKEPELTQEERKAQVEALINQCVAELYICEVDLMARLGEMKKIALQDWNYRSPEDRTKDKMIAFGFSWLEECYDLEVEIDRKVQGILDRCRSALEELGASTSVLDDLWVVYCEKKIDEKAYYLNKYLD